MDHELKPFWANCADCDHEWVAFYTPIPVEQLASFAKLPCPKCLSPKVMCGRKNEFKFVEAMTTETTKC